MKSEQLLKAILFLSGVWWTNLIVAIIAKACGASWAGSQFLVGSAVIYFLGVGCVSSWAKHVLFAK